MSHFTVIVIGESPEEQLIPYQENNMGDCPDEFLEFFETETERYEEYLNGTCERVMMPDGRLLSRFDEEFRKDGSIGIGSSSHEVPEHLEIRNVPFLEIYPTFDEFMREYHGYEQRDPKTGKYGYWDNPNAKWDWYELGGRWTGFFKLKEGFEEGVVGTPGLMTDEASEGYVDSARKGAIDFEFMRNQKANKAMMEYDLAQIIIGHLERNLTWEEVIEKYGEDYNGARKFYWSQPRCAVWKEKSKGNSDEFPFSWDSSPDDYLISRDEFVQRARQRAGISFAVLMDGKWYERGKMGWWAMVSDAMAEEEWDKQVSELLDSLPDDTLLSIYDCHI